MARGMVPRQPAKTGRQEGARPRPIVKTSRVLREMDGRGGPPPHVRQRRWEPGSATIRLAPERVSEILRRLDQLYPDVTCALHHKSAWELLVATILSAQSTDVNVNRVTPELFRKYPTVRGFCRAHARATATGYPFDWLFPQQSEIGGRSGQEDRERLRRAGAGRNGENAYLAGRGAKDGQRRAGNLVREGGGRGRGHARDAHLPPAGADQEHRRAQDRAGFDEGHPAGEVDVVFPSDHLAWTKAVHGAQAEMRRVLAGESVSCGGQDLEHGGDSQERGPGKFPFNVIRSAFYKEPHMRIPMLFAIVSSSS